VKRIASFFIGLMLMGAASAQGAGNTAALAWTAPTVNTDGSALTGALTYNIYQGAKGAEVKSVSGVTTTTYTVSSGLTDGSTVCWYVTAVEGGQESASSAEVCKTFPPAIPQAPASLTVK
jgi:hypothetical protein